MTSATLCLTPGDSSGIGPEITIKFLQRHLARFPQCKVLVVGDRHALAQAAAQQGTILPLTDSIDYLDTSAPEPGKTVYKALEKASELIAQGQADALVTGPLSKENLSKAGILASGHTEILEVLARRHYPGKKHKAHMMFLYRNFRILLLTRHIPLSQVGERLQTVNIRPAMKALEQFLQETLVIEAPKIAVMGVNPHAGEIGGAEEALFLEPVIEHLNQKGNSLWEGPLAADALFRRFDVNHIAYDAYVAPYHDQGLIPMKMIAGYKAVNVTIGLPFIRTSVSHGTAPDIAGQGIAREESMVEAVSTALKLIEARKATNIIPDSLMETAGQ